MLELLQERDSIQHESSQELGRKFHNFDIECVDVLIGKPDTAEAGGKIETLLEQLRLRQLSLEQVETYAKQVTASEKLRLLNEAQATAAMQTKLTNSLVQVQIVENEAEAQLAKARKEAEQKIVTAQAESQQRILAGRGEGARIFQEGLSEASVLVRKIQSFTDPRLYALSIVAQNLAREQPAAGSRARLHRRGRWRQQRPFGDGLPGRIGCNAGSGLLGMLLSLLVAEKSGFRLAGHARGNVLQEFCRQDLQAGHGEHGGGHEGQRGFGGQWKCRFEPGSVRPFEDRCVQAKAAAGRGGHNNRQQVLMSPGGWT